MASIDIFPISIGGVQPPLNLLSSIFSPNKGSKNFTYPLDLATNPTFAHAIQFTVFDYDYPGLSQATAGFQESLGQLAGSFSEVDFTNINGKTIEQLFNKAGTGGLNVLKNSLPFTQAQTYNQVTAGSAKATISLYMPDTLNTSYDLNYQTVSMTDTLGLAGFISNAFGDEKLRADFKNSPTNFFKSESGKQLSTLAVGALGNMAGMNGADLTGVLQQAFHQVPNPQMQLIYKGINLREFQFEFIFTPISAQEASAVDNIIKKFIYYSVPALSNSGQYLIPPQIFKIKFLYTGGSGVLNAISNVFQNTLTNVLGTQLSSALNPTNPSTIGGSENTKLFSIQDCVLTNVNVDYAPNGWAAYSDGHPVQTRLTLQFKEMDIITKKQVDPNQWSLDSATTAPTNKSPSSVASPVNQ